MKNTFSKAVASVASVSTHQTKGFTFTKYLVFTRYEKKFFKSRGQCGQCVHTPKGGTFGALQGGGVGTNLLGFNQLSCKNKRCGQCGQCVHAPHLTPHLTRARMCNGDSEVTHNTCTYMHVLVCCKSKICHQMSHHHLTKGVVLGEKDGNLGLDLVVKNDFSAVTLGDIP